jgi:hypothetical protein
VVGDRGRGPVAAAGSDGDTALRSAVIRCARIAAKSRSLCTTGCSTAASQTWTVDGIQLTGDIKSLVYKCNAITVNGN